MKKLAAMFVLILAAFALVACGGGDDTTSDSTAETPTTQEESGGGEKEAEGGTADAATLDFEADPSGALAYTTDSAESEAGKVTVNFTNSSPVPHDVEIEDSSGEVVAETEVLAEGSESTTADLKPGEYTFFCSVPGHRQGGMEGNLTVK